MTIAFDPRTAPFSRWSTVNHVSEPAHAYYARLVEAEGHSSVTTYSDWIDVRARNISPETLLDVIEKLPLSSERRDLLRRATPVRTGAKFMLCDEVFRYSDFSFTRRRWCPGCLHENAFHRTWWDIQAIQRCPLHDTELVDRCDNGQTLHWWWSGTDLSPEGEVLAKPMASSDPKGSLDGYLVGRLGFGPGFSAPLLDKYEAGTVIELCAVVGTLIGNPWSLELPEWDDAQYGIGFQALRSDGPHLVEELRRWLRANVATEMLARGWTIVFQWVRNRQNAFEDRDAALFLKTALRKALASEARVGAGPIASDAFLDAEVGLTELARSLGVNRRGLPAIADALGLLPVREWYRAPVKFDRTEADLIAFHVKSMMTRVEVAAALGMASQDVQPLVDAGYLRSFSNLIGNGPVGHRFLKSDVEKLLDFVSCTPEIEHAHSSAFFTYAKNNSVRLGDLAVQILKGEVGYFKENTDKVGFKRLRVIRN